MEIRLTVNASTRCAPRERVNERGAALVTVLLFSVLLLSAGGALIMTTALSATNAVDGTAETQAYYAAEAGMQATLAVIRGNVAPNPLFDTYTPTSDANKISFRKAVSVASSNVSGDAATSSNIARLSRWLNYNALTSDSRIEISSPYSVLSGMAYTTVVDDPDNTANQTYSTLGSFGTDTPSSSTISYQFGSGSNKVTVTYAPSASAAISASGTTLGTFSVNSINGSPDIAGDAKSTFVITVRQVTSTSTINVPIKLTLSYASSPSRVLVTFQDPSPTSNDISGTTYQHTASITLSSSGSAAIPVTITAPEPDRLRITIVGYGPRGAKKQMHMLLSRFAFDYTPSAAITLRSTDSTGSAAIAMGNSSQYTYTGNDNAGGANLPGVLVTSASDYTVANTAIPSGSTQVTGNPAVQQTSPSSLSSFLKSADNARALVDMIRIEAQTQGRYFTTSTPPSDFGASAPKGLITFVEGDVDLPPAGGAGLLLVTGNLTMRGSSEFKGVILVLGGGQLIRDGGGNGVTLGSIVVAKFGASGGFLAPTFNSNGSGTSDVKFDSKWTRNALTVAGPRVLGVSEY